MSITFKASKEKKNANFRLQKSDPLDEARIEQCSNPCFPPKSDRIFLETRQGFNHFVNTVHHAFANHHSFTLYPDHIWLLCLQGFATKMRSDPKKYGPVLLKQVNLSEDGSIIKEKLIVRRNDFFRGSNTNPWEEVFPEFTKQMNLKDANLFDPQFSTSTVVSKVACDIVAMDMLQDFFEYKVYSECGIPEIQVCGTTDDYKKLIQRVSKLASDLDMNGWFEHFEYTMKKLMFFLGLRGHSGEFDFFSSFYKYRSGSGTPDVTGWINVFFPFLKNGTVNHAVEWHSKSNRDGPSPTEFPTGISIAPVVWNDNGALYDYQFVAGMIGSSVTEEKHLTPTIGWYVRPTPK